MEIKRPEDWNNHKSWDSYYADVIKNKLFSQEHYCGGIGFRFNEQVKEWKSKEFKRIWVAGCGVSVLPLVLSTYGFEVYATDISENAIKFQQSIDKQTLETFISQRILFHEIHPEVEKIVKDCSDQAVSKPSKLTFEVQDFRQIYKEDFFDLILNIRAFQRFDGETMKTVGKTHYNSLQPNGVVYFEMININEEFLFKVEELLIKIGFFIPDLTWNRCIRAANKEYFDQRSKKGKMDYEFDVINEITNTLINKYKSEIEAEREKLLNEPLKKANLRFTG